MEEYKIINYLLNVLEKFDIINCLIDKAKIIIDNKTIELNRLINVFGNYNTFINNQESEGNDLWIINNFSKFDQTINPDKILSNWCIIGKLGYCNFVKKYIKYFIKYWCKRSDLNFIHRTYISFTKTNKNIYRFKIGIDVKKYFNEKNKFNKQIENLFNNKDIDRIYIYSYKNNV